ncbi:hypothetical protein J6590_008808 [Homalodisca vitripennis]|nr:hypothetical protein J6590_008808 [Homalodisca vitripennis]
MERYLYYFYIENVNGKQRFIGNCDTSSEDLSAMGRTPFDRTRTQSPHRAAIGGSKRIKRMHYWSDYPTITVRRDWSVARRGGADGRGQSVWFSLPPWSHVIPHPASRAQFSRPKLRPVLCDCVGRFFLRQGTASVSSSSSDSVVICVTRTLDPASRLNHSKLGSKTEIRCPSTRSRWTTVTVTWKEGW